MTTTEQQLRDLVAHRFGGVVRRGAHAPGSEAYALEALSQLEGQAWTDSPYTLNAPDLRALNDPFFSDALRTEWLPRVLVAVLPVWRSDPATCQAWVRRLALETVR